MLTVIETTKAALRKHVAERYGIEIREVAAEIPPRLEFGELASPLAFELAKKLKRSPRQIAQEIASEIAPIAGIARIEPAGGGYLNFFVDRWLFLRRRFGGSVPVPPSGGKIIVEHTNINPNKAAHIGHLRNAVLGDSFVRLLRFLGKDVEIQNYIDNTGVQVADVVVGFIHLRGMGLDEIRSLDGRFDYYCWDLYAQVSSWYKEDPSRHALRQQALFDIENAQDPAASIADHVATRIVQAHLQTMNRIGARYDLLPRESEILHLKFWEQAFHLLRERKAVEFENDGPHKGCWVMKFGPEADAALPDAKIIVRSNGTVTYVGKDIAYQMWKFGLLGKDFGYRVFFTYGDGTQIWMTAAEKDPDAPAFGRGVRVYNVIDSRQSYLQKVVAEGLRALEFREQAENSVHFSYEMVALSPRCCADLGIQLSPEEAAKPYVEVSGRKGLGVKADDLVDQLIAKALQEVERRGNFQNPQDATANAAQIAIGALRYFLARFARNSVIAFDFQEALSFEGETGPYVQYAAVRADNIFRKLQVEDPGWRGSLETFIGSTPGSAVQSLLADETLWSLLVLGGRLEQVVNQSVDTLEISTVAKHAFTVAQQFNAFYHRHHILSEQDADARRLLLVVAWVARDALSRLLDLLGIEVPPKM